MTRSGPDTVLYTGPFHTALRNAIRERELTLDRLRVHLARRGVSVGLSTLSGWQTGQSRPALPRSRLAIRALEDVLDLPSASLGRLLGGGDGARRGISDIGPVADLLDAVPGSRTCDLELVSVQHKIVVGSDGRTSQMWARVAVRALRDGVDRYVGRYYGGRGADPGLVNPQPLGNCRLGRIVTHRDEPALVYELVFDQTLRAGETWVFESQLTDRSAGGCDGFAFGFRSPAEQYVLEVRFHPGALPVRTYAFAQFDLSDECHPTTDLQLSKHHTVHLIASMVDSGVLGINWAWR